MVTPIRHGLLINNKGAENIMIKKFSKALSMLTLFTAILSISNSALAVDKPLYNRLGGYDALAAVVDDLMGRLAKDEQVGRVLKHIPDSRFNHVRQHMVDFLCAATGGPCKYTGKTMLEAHKGMGLTESDWNKTINHLLVTLKKFSVPEKEKDEVISAIAGLKLSIIDS